MFVRYRTLNTLRRRPTGKTKRNIWLSFACHLAPHPKLLPADLGNSLVLLGARAVAIRASPRSQIEMRSNPASFNRNCPTLPEIAGSPIGAVTPGVVRKKL